MTVARVKSWVSEVLTASDLNAEFNNVLNWINSATGPVVYSATLSWTPTDASGAGLVLTINNAGYVPVGNLMFVWAAITFPATADATQVTIGGLPAAVKNTTGTAGGFSVLGLSTDYGRFTPGGTTLKVYTVASAIRPNSGYSAGGIFFQGWYPIA